MEVILLFSARSRNGWRGWWLSNIRRVSSRNCESLEILLKNKIKIITKGYFTHFFTMQEKEKIKMCGIVGYVGKNNQCIKVLLDGLSKLEYRGYDSAGIAYLSNNIVKIEKESGK